MKKTTCRCKSPSAPHPRFRCNHKYEDHPRGSMREPTVPGERVLSVAMGGELADRIRDVLDREIECLGTCRKTLRVTSVLGYPDHEGGYADATGRKWWAYVHCPECDYETALWKVPVQAHKAELTKAEATV